MAELRPLPPGRQRDVLLEAAARLPRIDRERLRRDLDEVADAWFEV